MPKSRHFVRLQQVCCLNCPFKQSGALGWHGQSDAGPSKLIFAGNPRSGNHRPGAEASRCGCCNRTIAFLANLPEWLAPHLAMNQAPEWRKWRIREPNEPGSVSACRRRNAPFTVPARTSLKGAMPCKSRRPDGATPGVGLQITPALSC